MKLIEYLPNFMQDIKEFKELFASEDIEIEKLNAAIEKITDEVIVKRAKDYGLERYEKIYNTVNTSSDLEIRRLNILSKMNNRTPFTMKWLEGKLNELVGEDNYSLEIDYNSYALTIKFDALYSEASEIFKKDFTKQIPANILLGIRLFSYCNTYIGSMIIQKQYEEMKIDTSTIIQKEQFNNTNYNAGVLIQKEFSTIEVDDSIIKETESILHDNIVAINTVQKEYIEMKEES